MLILGIGAGVLGLICIGCGFINQFWLKGTDQPQDNQNPETVGAKAAGAAFLLTGVAVLAFHLHLGFRLSGVGVLLMLIGALLNPSLKQEGEYRLRAETAMWLFLGGTACTLLGVYSAF